MATGDARPPAGLIAPFAAQEIDQQNRTITVFQDIFCFPIPAEYRELSSPVINRERFGTLLEAGR